MTTATTSSDLTSPAGGINVAVLTTAQVQSLSSAQVGALTSQQLSAKDASGHTLLSDLAVSQIPSLNVAALTTAQVQSLSSAQVGALTTQQLSAKDSNGTAGLTAIQISALSTIQSALKLIISMGLPANILGAFEQSLLANAQAFGLSSQLVLTGQSSGNALLADLSASQIPSLNIAVLTTAQVQSLSSAQVGALTSQQLSAKDASGHTLLSDLAVSQIPSLNVAALTTAQVQSLSSAQVGALTTQQLSAKDASGHGLLADLGASQIPSLNIAVLTAGQIAALTPAQVASLTIAQLHAFNGGQIAALSANDLAALSNAQRNALVVVNANPISSAGYYADTLPLFSAKGPSITDVNQQGIGDCYFLAGLAGLAQDDPAFIQSMIKSVGNSAYSVRFFNNGQADWVTVDNQVANNGADSTVDSWVAIVEKAYVVFNSLYLGKANNYTAINGGFANGLQAVTGDAVTDYFASSSSLAVWGKEALAVEADLKAGEVVMYASCQNTTGANGKTDLVSSHMLTVTGFDSATGDFILRNPWGTTYGAPSWNITFEASIQELYGNGGSTAGAFIVNDSIGANGSAGQLTQAMASMTNPMASVSSSMLANNQNVVGVPVIAVMH